MSDRMQLVVATPCFGGQVSSIYASSIFALQRAVHGMSNLELKVHCKRWTDIGGEIWADIQSSLDHVGRSVFRGDITSQFAAAPAVAAAA
jgi:hypothetical protein